MSREWIVDEDTLRDLASSACQEALSFGVNEDVFMRLARTVELRARDAAPQNDESQNVARIEWDGEGLPPAGTACDIRQTTLPNEWVSATVLFVGDRRVFYRTADGDEMSRPIKFLLFRKIRTPEQIAADEREKARDEVLNLMAQNAGLENEELWQLRLKIVGEMLDWATASPQPTRKETL